MNDMREAPIIFLELESISYYFFLIAVFFMADASGSNGTGSYSPRRKIGEREWIVLRECFYYSMNSNSPRVFTMKCCRCICSFLLPPRPTLAMISGITEDNC